MLKESGLYAAARQSYERAAALRPADPEPHVQLAILAKVLGRFVEAAALYQRSLSLGYSDPAFIRAEIEFLRRSGPPPKRSGDDQDVIIYLSSASSPVSESDPGKLKQFLGAPNYSYGYSLRGYHTALTRAGLNCQLIRNPEYRPDVRNTSAAKAIHIGFYPPDGQRFLKGAYNIACIAWEFERLRSKAEANSYHAFADAATMLSQAQEVWVVSEYGAEAVRRSSGIERVRAVASPVPCTRQTGRAARPILEDLQSNAIRLDRLTWVPLAIFPTLQDSLSGAAEGRRASLLNWLIDVNEEQPPVIFLSVFNVHDFRKQMKPVLEAFARYTHENPNAYLLLKVSCIDSDRLDINRMMLMDQVSDAGEMTPPLVSDRVLMTTDALSRDEMNTLFDIASYYVCTSHGEGQNLPLIEAMGAGVVPVSVDHTAMAEYIDQTNAFVIPSQLAPFTPRLADRYGMYGVNTYYVDGRSVYQTIARAMAQSDSDYAAMSDAAVTCVIQRFGPDVLLSAVRQYVASMAAPLSGTTQP
jgi:glycosyltransferase involved in cell wall biosynthesis